MTGPDARSKRALGDLFEHATEVAKTGTSKRSVTAKTEVTRDPLAEPPMVDLVERRPEDRFLTVDIVCKRYAISRATVWRWVANDISFPKPIQLSSGTSRWSERQLLDFEARAASDVSKRSSADSKGKSRRSRKRSLQ